MRVKRASHYGTDLTCIDKMHIILEVFNFFASEKECFERTDEVLF